MPKLMTPGQRANGLKAMQVSATMEHMGLVGSTFITWLEEGHRVRSNAISRAGWEAMSSARSMWSAGETAGKRARPLHQWTLLPTRPCDPYISLVLRRGLAR